MRDARERIGSTDGLGRRGGNRLARLGARPLHAVASNPTTLAEVL